MAARSGVFHFRRRLFKITMATQAQIAANQQNAQHSTGPTTEAGREAVSQNATKHGLTGQFILLNEKEEATYFGIHKRIMDDLKPANFFEAELIDKMTESLWRSGKAVSLQDTTVNLLAFETDDREIARLSKQLELYMRYQSNHDRAYQRYAAELRKVQAERKKAEIGSVSQKRIEAEEMRKQAAETRKAEDHKITMDVKAKRLEREKSLALVAGLKAGEQMSKTLPPNWEELLAA
jgi:hypothetical protein